MTGENLFKSMEIQQIHEDAMRSFTCWGSVEVLDRHGEIIPFEEVKKVMDIWMDRGAPIMFNHTNRQVGKGTNWQPLEKNGKPGVLITGKIFNHYNEDDEVWKGIKEGEFEGLSIGGKSFSREKTGEGTILRDLIGYEFSVVQRTGNQEATFVEVNQMAKSEIKKEEAPMVDKPEEEQKQEDGALTELKTMVEALVERLGALEGRVEEMTAGKPEEPEEAVEENKSEDEEPTEEEKTEDEEDEEVTKKLSALESKVSELTKALEKKTVTQVIKTERPAEKETVDNSYEELRKSFQGKSKIDFAEIGARMRGMQ